MICGAGRCAPGRTAVGPGFAAADRRRCRLRPARRRHRTRRRRRQRVWDGRGRVRGVFAGRVAAQLRVQERLDHLRLWQVLVGTVRQHRMRRLPIAGCRLMCRLRVACVRRKTRSRRTLDAQRSIDRQPFVARQRQRRRRCGNGRVPDAAPAAACRVRVRRSRASSSACRAQPRPSGASARSASRPVDSNWTISQPFSSSSGGGQTSDSCDAASLASTFGAVSATGSISAVRSSSSSRARSGVPLPAVAGFGRHRRRRRAGVVTTRLVAAGSDARRRKGLAHAVCGADTVSVRRGSFERVASHTLIPTGATVKHANRPMNTRRATLTNEGGRRTEHRAFVAPEADFCQRR